MTFIDYKAEVEKILERKKLKLNSLDDMFESYVNGINPRVYAKSIKNSLHESKSESSFNKYLRSVISLVKKSGFSILKMPRELNEDLIDLYNEGCGVVETANYIVEKVEKNVVKIEKKADIDDVRLKHQLMIAIHDIPDVALRDIEIKSSEAYATLRVRIFDLRNEINTDIKSYLAGIDKYFRPYVKQNIDNNTRVQIIGYTMNQTSVYCTIKLKVDLVPTEDDSMTFSAKETANNIKMYVNIFKTFGEQYKNLV